jgi:hypothetical protein
MAGAPHRLRPRGTRAPPIRLARAHALSAGPGIIFSVDTGGGQEDERMIRDERAAFEETGAMCWQRVTWGLLGVGSLAACHSGGDAAPDGKTATATAAGATAEEAPAGGSPAPEAEPVAPAAAPASPAPDGDCEARRAGIEAALGEAGRCSSDADCTLMYPNCPFGCARPVSTSANVGALQTTIEAYKAACNTCVYRCMPPKGPPTCRGGRCSFGDD